MIRRSICLGALLLCAAASAAGPAGPQAAYDAAAQDAERRYADDRKLCAEESSSARRMQCLRDARDEYNRALDAAESKRAVVTRSAPIGNACADCGTVVSVSVSERDGEGGAVGMIAGGVAGALLGRQVGKGSGKDLATIAGAAGGAYAGRTIEGKMSKVKTWAIGVRFDNGSERSYSYSHDPGLAVGDLVKATGDGVVRR